MCSRRMQKLRFMVCKWKKEVYWLMDWSIVCRKILFFESVEIRSKFIKLIPDEDYTFMQERTIDKKPKNVLHAKFKRVSKARPSG